MTVSIGLLSTAHVHTGGFATVLSELDDVSFVGVADDDQDRGAAVADRFDVDLLSTDALLDRADGVVVCSTNATHGKWVRAAAEAGVHVLCEKPLATTLAEARDLVETCAETGVTLGMCMPLPFTEPARRAREAYQSGAIGELVLATGTNRAKLRNRHKTGWSADPEHAGGGAVMDHTVHIVNLVRWITGGEVTRVHAELATMEADLDVEDVNVLSMELDDGTPFTLDGSWDRPESWDYWGDATLNLVGTDGELAIDCFDYTFTETRDGGESPGINSVYWGDEPNAGLFADFVAAIRDGRETVVTGRDGLREAAVCLAAYESAACGEPVSVADWEDVDA
ncbi:Gfo/Idh/MocA family protein [Haladaptatus sp. GCM10025707]|uniref:Gfo/Idh/MocA family protein n=1 Tax=unclassified Haladaptatus TaxID=2622732 RepID=UPI0023E89802|nr:MULTISPECIES: Gfo/Idh/MocA family oxidoreductase [unclassified Haladaptatus]